MLKKSTGQNETYYLVAVCKVSYLWCICSESASCKACEAAKNGVYFS